MADKIFEDDTLETMRFWCNCFDPGHSITFTIEKVGDHKECTVSLFTRGKASFWRRVKEAWKILRGRDVETHDIGILPKDNRALVSFLSQLVFSSTTGDTYLMDDQAARFSSPSSGLPANK